jgi:uracil-DNA glycosylase
MPYAKKGQATGLAFAVNEHVMLPASLRVIKNEIAKERGQDGQGLLVDPTAWNTDKWQTLDHWWHQGVLLLNAALTVKAGASGSHMVYWQWFTREVIRTISINADNPIWLMWGSKAKSYVGYIHAYYKWNNTWKGKSFNYVLEADHPAAETYPGSTYKFSGCDHFRKVNEILKYKEEKLIYW